MFSNYNLFYYYRLLIDLDNGINKLSNLIEQNKVKNIWITIQICLISGLIAFLSTYLNSNIFFSFINNSENLGSIIYLISFIVGSLAPIGIFLAIFIFFYIVSSVQVVEHKTINKVLFSISLIGYLPILIGSIINLLLNVIFGFNTYGYTTAYGIFRPENHFLVSLTQEIDPFKFLGLFVSSYLYCNIFDKGKIQIITILFSWYILNFIFILLSR